MRSDWSGSSAKSWHSRGIFGHVVQPQFGYPRIGDQFPAVPGHGALQVAIGGVDRGVVGTPFAADDRQQTLEGHRLVRLGAGQFQHGGHDVLVIDRLAHPLARGRPRTGYDERHPHAVIVHVLLAE